MRITVSSSLSATAMVILRGKQKINRFNAKNSGNIGCVTLNDNNNTVQARSLNYFKESKDSVIFVSLVSTILQCRDMLLFMRCLILH